ncbi:MAG TPA: Hpt domain-containing protein, partial [Bacteroidota bacterium]
ALPEPEPGSGSPLDMNRINELKRLSDQHAPGLLAQLTEGFDNELPVRIEELRQAAASGDREAFHAAAHSVAGISGNVGAVHLLKVARDLQAWERSAPLTGAATIINRLEAEFTRARAALHGVENQSTPSL